MVKTLRITTILIAVAALGLIIFIASKGSASDAGIEKILAAQGIAEQMQGKTGGKNTGIEQDTPLIRQAKAFALRINPPPPPEPVRTEAAPQEEIRPKVEISAKFKLIGTSYHTGDEESSWALIDEVGKGWHWVRQGERIDYLVIEKIGDGVVLIRDGNKTYELAAEKAEKPDYVKSFSGTAGQERIIPDWQGKKTAVTEAGGESGVSNTENQAEDPNAARKQVQENIDWLKQIQANPASAGMTAEEANELGGLGEFLKTVEAGLPAAESNEPNTSVKPAPVKPEPVKPEPPKVKDVNEKQSPQMNRNKPRLPDPNRMRRDNAGSRGPRRIIRPKE